jgi:c-di-GMP-binding flagellar brake protein YcgR
MSLVSVLTEEIRKTFKTASVSVENNIITISVDVKELAEYIMSKNNLPLAVDVEARDNKVIFKIRVV